MSTNDGGPAFPTPGWQRTWFERGDECSESCDAIAGMSLRDYFAAKALAAMMATPDVATALVAEAAKLSRDVSTVFAEAAYEQADAMIAERAKAMA
ncbi:MAG TPA: hypothetical protein VEL07_19415 [Planctomycetota bacterium]|nr:hypothetical protein [Planctomycetota bacterium]